MIGLIAFLTIAIIISFFYGVAAGSYQLPPYSRLFKLKGYLPEPIQPYSLIQRLSENKQVSISKEVMSKLDSEAETEVQYHFLGTGNSSRHSNCIFVKSEYNILIDTGMGEIGTKPETTASSVVDYIESCGVKKIDTIIITHFHGDHIGGLPMILDSFIVNEVLAPEFTIEKIKNKYREDIEDIILEQEETTYELVQAGEKKEFGGLNCQFLSPSKNYEYCDTISNSEDNNSVVTKIESQYIDFLSMGDSSRAAENDILDKYKEDLKADILQVGKHGRTNASTIDFLRAVDPEEAIIIGEKVSSDCHPDVIDRLEKLVGATVYQTHSEGTIVIEEYDNKYELHSCY